jgi:hypothetical protein
VDLAERDRGRGGASPLGRFVLRSREFRWYPRAWRERYGEELLALIQDTLDEGRPTWRLRLSVARGGLRERAHQAGHPSKATIKRLDVAARWLTMPGTMILLLSGWRKCVRSWVSPSAGRRGRRPSRR